MTHLLKLVDEMCKHEMDPVSIVGDTEWACLSQHTERWTDGRTDGRTKWNQYTPLNFVGDAYKDTCTHW